MNHQKLTEVPPLGFRVGEVRSIVVWPPRLGSGFWKLFDGHTETAFPYGDHATFALKVLLYQFIESVEVGVRSTLELVELAGSRGMASDSCIEAYGMPDQPSVKWSLR